MHWKYSSAGVRSIATALRETGRAEEILALSGGRVETLFAGFNEHLKRLMQGVRVQWEKTGPSSGVLTVVHQDAMKPVAFPSWRGSLRYAFLLAGVEGELVPRTPSPDDLRFTFDVRWKS